MALEYQYYYLSELLKARVRYRDEERAFGRLRDLGAVREKETPYPNVVCLDVKTRTGETALVAWSAVESLSTREIVVRKGGERAVAAEFWLWRDVLDDQVVDLSGAKVWRVNDVHLLHTQGRLIPGHVEVGILGILRRLGVATLVCGLLRWLFDYEVKVRFVRWPQMEVVSPGPSPGGVRVSAEADRLADVHPAELAEIMSGLGVRERQTFFETMAVETAAEALQASDREVQRSLLTQEEPGKAAVILEELPAKEAAGVLRDLAATDAQLIMSRMNEKAAADVRRILAHGERTAGGVMCTSCIETRPDERAGEVLERVRSMADEVEVFHSIYVLDEERRLVGILSLRELMRAAPDAFVGGIMTRHVVTVRAQARLKDVARLIAKYGFRTVPVVDEEGVFLGAVRLRGILEELSPVFRE